MRETGFGLRGSCSAAVLALSTLAVLPAHASAQEVAAAEQGDAAAGDDSGGLGDIVVTARRVAENLQDVPVAVTAFTGAQLQQQNALKLSDISRMTPGLVIRTGSTGNTAVTFQIRGQFQNDTLATLDPSVGVYVDGLYWARAYGINADLLDISSAQTLKGPQGTLFGRNTTGGAVLIETADPNFNGISGMASGTYGRFNERAVTAVLNLPLIDDRVALRGAYQIIKRDGYIRDSVSGRDLDDRDSWTGRAKLLVKPTDTLRILLSAELFDFKSYSNPWKLSAVNPNSSLPLVAGIQTFGPGDAATRAAQGRELLNDYIAGIIDSDNIGLAFPSYNTVKTQTYSGKIDLETFFGGVQFIGGYRHVRNSSDLPLTGAPYRGFESFLDQDLKQYSGEFQITGKTADERIDFVGGAFYFYESGYEFTRSNALTPINPNNPALTDGDVTTRSQGVYGQATFHATDALSLTGGLRYSVEDKGIVLRNRSFNAAANTFLCGLPTTNADCSLERSDDFSGLSYLASVDYQVARDTLVYAKSSKGFRSGGQNLRASGATVAFRPFNPETVYAHEVGLKTELFDRRVRLNMAGYYSTVLGIQRSTLVTTPQGQAITIVGNAGKARIWGGEAEVSALVAEGLELAGTFAMTRPKYLEYSDGVVDRRAERFDNVARHTFTLSANYVRDFDFGKLTLHADYAWQGRTPLSNYTAATDTSALTPAQKLLIQDFATAKANGVLGARASLGVMDNTLEFAVFGRNLTNNRTRETSLYLSGGLGYILNRRKEPFTFGGTVTYRFGDQ